MKKRLADMIKAGFEDAIAYAKGDTSRGVKTTYAMPAIDVKAIRKKSGLDQKEFSRAFGIKAKTLQDWEEYKRTPYGQSRELLVLIKKNPKVVTKTLRALGKINESLPKKRKKPSVQPVGIVKKAKKLDGPPTRKVRKIA